MMNLKYYKTLEERNKIKLGAAALKQKEKTFYPAARDNEMIDQIVDALRNCHYTGEVRVSESKTKITIWADHKDWYKGTEMIILAYPNTGEIKIHKSTVTKTGVQKADITLSEHITGGLLTTIFLRLIDSEQ